jgi:hypothetical protein
MQAGAATDADGVIEMPGVFLGQNWKSCQRRVQEVREGITKEQEVTLGAA